MARTTSRRLDPSSAPVAIVTLSVALGTLVGASGLVGRLFQIPALMTLGLGGESIRASTSVCLILLALSIALLDSSGKEGPSARSRTGGVAASLVFAIGAITLAEYLSGADLLIDRMFPGGDALSRRMAPNTASALVLAGGSLCYATLAQTSRRWREWTQWMSVASGTVALFAAVGYVYGVRAFYGFAQFTAMAAPTAVSLLGLSIGALILRDDYRARRILASRGPGGTLARRLLPAVLLVPVVLGWLRLQLQFRYQLVETAEGVALLVALFILFFCGLVWSTSQRLDRSAATLRSAYAELEDRVRDRTRELQLANEELASLVVQARASEERAQANQRLFRILFEQGRGLICIHDFNGQILMVNAAAAAALGYQVSEMTGRSLAEFLRPDVRDRFAQYLLTAHSGDVSGRMHPVTRSGENRVWAFHNTVHVDAEGKSFVIGNAADVTDEVRAATRLAEDNRVLTDLATTDELTGLPNRRRFDDRLSVALAQARRDGTRLALLFIDLDHFKRVNDTFGHAVGDGLLQAVSRRIAGIIRSSDTFARLGGDEFVLLLARVEGREPAQRVAEKILQLFGAPIDVAGNPLRVTLSTGISVFPEDGNDADSLLRRADAAMYESKQARSNPPPPFT